MPSIINKVKNALHADTPTSHFGQTEDLPGSYPEDRREHTSGSVSDRLKDGSEYIAPTGTAVGTHGVDRSSYDQKAENTMNPNVDERKLMDPADRAHGSNVMSSTGTGGDPVNRAERVTSASEGSHHNKLHKRQDSRGYDGVVGAGETSQVGQRDYGVSSSDDPTRTSGSLRRQDGHENLTDSERHGHHAGATTAVGGGLAAAGAGAVAAKELPERHRHHGGADISSSAYTGEPHGRDSHAYGQGVYNTVTGAGSGETHDRREHVQYGAPTETYHAGSVNDPRQPGISTDTYHGASATHPQQYGASTDTHHAGPGASAAATAAAVGAAGAASSHRTSGQHGYPESDTRGAHARPTETEQWPLGHSTSVADRKPVPSGGTSDPTTTTRHAVIGGPSDPSSVSHQAPASQTIPAGHQAYEAREAPSSTIGPAGSNIGAAPVSYGNTKGADTTVRSGGGPDHYGPGHSGAKVLHSCTNCGHDNDISHYFRKDVTYRIG